MDNLDQYPPGWDGVCNVEQIARKKCGDFLTVVGFKLSTVSQLCEGCPAVEQCEPEIWRQKNQVRVHVGKNIID